EEIPKHLHFRERNPQIADFANIPAQLPLTPISWQKRANHPRRAGVSSFAFSGTNAHVILEEAPEQDLAQVKQPLPKTIFNRQRYWARVLDEQRTTSTLMHSYELRWQTLGLSIKEEFVANKEGYQILVIGEDDSLHRDTLSWLSLQSLNITKLSINNLSEFTGSLSLLMEQATAQKIEIIWCVNANKEVDDLENYHERLCCAWLALLQACSRHAEDRRVSLNILSLGLDASVEGGGIPAGSILFGLKRTTANEYPQWKNVSVNITEIGQLTEALRFILFTEKENTLKKEQELQYDGKVWSALRLVSLDSDRNMDWVVSSEATYVITGGYGAIGQAYATHLIAKGAKHLILTSRRAADNALLEKIAEWKNAGVEVTPLAMDISDAQAVDAFIQTYSLHTHPIKGIVHAAGVLADAMLFNQDWEKFKTVLAGKAWGAWNLHRSTLKYGVELDFFIACSSIAGILGSPGQSNYAAANTFLDGLMRYRQAQGLAGLSIAWGPWRDGGMAAEQSVLQQKRWAEYGIELMGAEEALSIGWHFTKNAAVLRVNWQHWQILAVPAVLSELVKKVSVAKTIEHWQQSWWSLSKAEQKPWLITRLRELVSNVLGFKESIDIIDTRGFFEYGMDSLLAMELRNRLQLYMGESFNLSQTLVFDYPNVETLSTYLHDLLSATVNPQQRIIYEHEGEPIAIIGMACRFPQAVDTETFWLSLQAGVDGIQEVLKERWDVNKYYSADPGEPGKMITRWGGFIDDIDLFDAIFFGISPREAVMLDPQQRITLETVWYALEDAGYEPAKLRDSFTGVYLGISNSDYSGLLLKYEKEEDIDAYLGTGNALSAAVGRVSYMLGLRGPSLAIDTACSSSLVAIHQACQALRNGECDLALAGGVNLILLPEINISLSKAHMLSPEGHCKTFDESADGYVRSDGCGMVILKRLSEAQRDNDRILAMIKGSAVNQDGASGGLTVPNGVAQQAVLRQALAMAHIAPEDVTYVEAHGTGTSLGDPIEMSAIKEVYMTPDRQVPLRVGAVKSNIGHLEAAAGVAGVIKTVLALQNKIIPRNLHFHKLNSHIELPEQIILATELHKWESKEDQPLCAGVSAFGFTGTIAHMILEEAPEQDVTQIRQPLPKTIFNRQRYWADALDEARKNADAITQDWFYQARWIEHELDPLEADLELKRWVIIEEEGDVLARKLQKKLEAQGASVQRLRLESLADVLSSTTEDEEGVGIIDIASYQRLSAVDVTELQAVLTDIFVDYQSIFRSSRISHCVWLTALGTLEAEIPFLYLLRGLAKVIAWEFSETFSQVVEIESDDEATDEYVLNELLVQNPEVELIRYQASHRYVQQVEHIEIPLTSGMMKWDKTGSYVITGGSGGLGLTLMEWLAQRGVGSILLLSRHAPEEKILAGLREKYSCEIRHYAVDVSNEQGLAKVLQPLLAEGSSTPLRGLYHLAGTNYHASFTEYPEAELWPVVSPKALGSWYLHQLTKDYKGLDQFVLFSSISSFLGSNRESAYVLGNSFIDGVAELRRAEGLPVTAINWGPWGEVGMAFKYSEGEKIEDIGFISPQEGIRVLEALLASSQPQNIAIISPIYLTFMLQFRQPLPTWLAAILPFTKKVHVELKSEFLKEYEQTAEDARYALLEDLVARTLREILKTPLGYEIDKAQGFAQMGMDSLMAVELYNHLQQVFGKELSLRATLGFDYPTVMSLTEYLYMQLESLTLQHGYIEYRYVAEPIAVIGMACDFPGGADSIEQFWENLVQGKDAITLAPQNRWDSSFYPFKGGFVDDMLNFDASFFGISPREAEYMDPQQRKALEISWHALEDAGINPRELKNSLTAVFVGISQSDYGALISASEIEGSVFLATGNALNATAGRISYTLGLQGPAIAMDTACSSSLVALHEACRSLQTGESSLAICIGVNALLAAHAFEILTQAQMLSPEGYCKTFDANADGYVRGEGCGVLILKRLSEAEHDSDHILAIIKGSAVNQDGASSGLTVPNGIAQETVLKKALANANIMANEVDYIEAHGTGTSLGDPIEIGALTTVYGNERDPAQPLIISTVKTNIGHLESAAGIAGMIKTILALHYKQIPPHLHFHTLNPHINLQAIPAEIPLSTREWEYRGHPRRAGVSSFGFTGTNAHIILEEAPEQDITQLRQPLPKTIFNRQEYWVKPSIKNSVAIETDAHPFLQQTRHLPGDDAIYYESHISRDYPDFIIDHQIHDYLVVAAAAYLSAALTIAQESLGGNYCRLSDVVFTEPIILSKDGELVQLLIKLTEEEEKIKTLDFYSQAAGQDEWRSNVSMLLELIDEKPISSISETWEVLRAKFPEKSNYKNEELMARMKTLGFLGGPHFIWLEEIYVNQTAVLAKLRQPLATERGHYVLYPGALDSCLQALLALLQENVLTVPFSIESFVMDLSERTLGWVYASYQEETGEANCILLDEHGGFLGEIKNYKTRKASKEGFEHVLGIRREAQSGYYYDLLWKKIESPPKEINVARLEEGENIIYDARQPVKSVGDLSSIEQLLKFIQTRIVERAATAGTIYIVTEQAYSVKEEAINLMQSCMNGLIKTAILEHPELHIKQLDLAEGAEINREMLVNLPENEQILVYRTDQLYTQRVTQHLPSSEIESINVRLDSNASYLITGGLGGIGLELVKYLSEHGAKRIILSARHVSDSTIITAINQMRELNIEIATYQSDVSDRVDVTKLLEIAHVADYPLKGIFHLAGVIKDAPLDEQTNETFSSVFAPKAQGAWNLHEITQEKNIILDYFVMFSSMSSLNGAIGQANYATANSFLDALAVYRQQRGLAGLSLNWGPWREVGMARGLVNQYQSQGIIPFKTSEAFVALSYALQQSGTQLGLMHINPKKMSEQITTLPSWLSFILEKTQESLLIKQLQNASPEEWETIIKNIIAQETRKVLGLLDAQVLDENKSFFEIGMDSLLALELKNRLQRIVQQPLSNTLVFTYPSLNKLSVYLYEMLEETSRVISAVQKQEKIDLPYNKWLRLLYGQTFIWVLCFFGRSRNNIVFK
ncbi:MAG: SDR family NAD(P)-dependent oxidoreductase, partial [Gammaproteobacteria bacterium]